MKKGEEKYLSIFEDGKYFDLLQLSDAKLNTDDGCTFDIHRITLAKNSEYFRAMFCGKNRTRVQFKIPGISGDCLGDILCYLYTKVIDVSDESIGDILIATDYLLLSDLYLQIKRTITDRITASSCLRIYQAAIAISDEDISHKSFRFIQTHFEKVACSEMDFFSELRPDVLESILSNRCLWVYNESTVWRVIAEWTLRDFEQRARWIPQFLSCMATKEIEENLASDILKHEIVSKNPYVPQTEIPNKCVTSQDRLSFLLRNCSDATTELFDYRIPSRIFFGFFAEKGYNWFVSYDQNVDLWRKVSESRVDIPMMRTQFVPVKHNVYFLDKWTQEMMSFDLSRMECVPLGNMNSSVLYECAVTLGDCIYAFFDTADCGKTNNVHVYDTTHRRWSKGVSFRNLRHPCAVVTYDKKIYLVGVNPRRRDQLVAQVFDSITLQWSDIRSPNDIIPSRYFLDCNFIALNHKLYLIDYGRTKLFALVYDPATNLWKQLPDPPYSYLHGTAIVFKDRLLVYESFQDGALEGRKALFWNERDECWENLRDTDEKFFPNAFCAIEDVETLKIITKQNRDFKAQYITNAFN